MKLFISLILLMFLVGCVTTEYTTKHPSGVIESFKLTTFLKSVDGLQVLRTPDIFAMGIDKTNTNDVLGDVARILEFYSDPVTTD